MKKHLYLMPVLALSLASFALAGCDDNKEGDAPADTTAESTLPPATETPVETAPVVAQAETTVHVSDAVAFATAEGATNGAIFATLHNPQTSPDLLTGVKTDVSTSAEIHQTYMDPQTNTMLMRSTSGVDIAAGQEVKLEPSGYHIMLLGLNKPLVEGETFNVTLTFRNAGDVVVPVTVTAPGAATGGEHMSHDDTTAPADATASEATAEAAPAESISGDEEAVTPAPETTEAPVDATTPE